MKKHILLSALLPLPVHAALVDMWNFNDVAGGAVADGTPSIGVNGGVAVIRGAGASSDVMTTMSGAGGRGINLPGGASSTAAYIDMPNGLASAGLNLTLNTWMTIDSVQGWSRVFDFGSTDTGVGPQGGELFGPGGGGQGFEYILLSAMNGGDPNTHRMENRENGFTTNTTDGVSTFAFASEHLWTFVWEDMGGGLARQSYYFDGILNGQSAPFASNLAQLNDVNNWLGRSNWTGDANTDGTYDQFEVYNNAFTPAEVAASFAAGPVPEPSGTLILAGSLLGLLARRRRA